jgi:hypothetical protein
MVYKVVGSIIFGGLSVWRTFTGIAGQYLIKFFSVSYGGVHDINGSCQAVKFGLSSSIKIYAR